MKTKFIFFCAGLMILFNSCTNETSVQVPNESHTIQLRESVDFCMTSYNIKAFCEPGAPNFEGSAESYGRIICESIKSLGSDFVNLQEVWCEPVAEAIENCLKADGYKGFKYEPTSGLMSISKEEFDSSQSIPFTGPEGGADFLKDKGFIHTSFEVMDGCTINIINTHTQADNLWYEDVADFIIVSSGFLLGTRHRDTAEDKIRQFQLQQIKDYMEENIDDCELTIIGGDFNVKKIENGQLTQEFQDLITLVQGQPTHLITTTSTTEEGDILDYFLVSNFNQFSEDLESITTTVYDLQCNPLEIVRYNVYEYDNYEYPPTSYLVASFETIEEAEELIDEMEEINIENGEYFATYEIEREISKICLGITNPSDHNMVETCIENYNCEQDCN